MKKQLPAWAALGIIALMAGLLLGATNDVTAGQIKVQTLAAANEARQKVLPGMEEFVEISVGEGAPVDNCFAGMSGANTYGFTAQVTAKGYGGPIEVTVGMDMNANITGISVGGSGFAETAGLGAKTKDAKFTEQFAGIIPPAELKKNVDGVTAATISSKAVVSAVNTAADFIKDSVLTGKVG